MLRNRTLAITGLLILAVVGMSVGLVLAGPTSGDFSSGPQAETQTALNEEQVSATATGGGGTHEGIKVHGHWVIEVREPDGRLASRTEFDNAFSDNGHIQQLLARERSAGLWNIELRTQSGGTNPCHTSSGTSVRCFLVESGSTRTPTASRRWSHRQRAATSS